MIPAIQTQNLLLHCDTQGTLWTGDDVRVPKCTELPYREWLKTLPGREAVVNTRRVRVLGTPPNAGLITALLDMRTTGELPESVNLQAGSPVIAQGAGTVAAKVLGRAWHACATNDPAARWFDLEERDKVQYQMGQVLLGLQRERDVAVLRQLLSRHPAYSAVSFVSGYYTPWACAFLAMITDVRFFDHPERPGRLSRLNAYLGVSPGNAAALLNDAAPPNKHFERASVVCLAMGADKDLGVSLFPVSDAPGAFLGRIYVKGKTPAAGLLAAMQKYVRFVREVWVGARRPLHPFDPDLFFENADESGAYRVHLAVLKAVDELEGPL